MHRYVFLAIIGCILMQQMTLTACQGGVDCNQPIMTGPCRAGFRKYGYDTAKGRCTEFTYGGCKGNSNRFNSLAECQAACEAGSNTVNVE